jgi:integrase
LTWKEIENGCITRRLEKTQVTIKIPIHTALAENLDRLPRTGPAVLGHAKSMLQLHRELGAICKVAGVPRATPQGFRRCSARAWEKARAGCGAAILGHVPPGALRFYADQFAMLESAIPDLEIPEGMGTKPERPKQDGGLLDSLRKLPRAEVANLLAQLLGAEGVPT